MTVVVYYFSNFQIKLFLAGKSKEEAMSDYITKVKQLQEEAAAAASA